MKTFYPRNYRFETIAAEGVKPATRLFAPPRFGIGVGVSLAVGASLTTALAVGSLGVGVAGMGMSLAGSGGASQPNMGAANQKVSDANAAILPIQRGMSAASQTGGSYTFALPAGITEKQIQTALGTSGGGITKNADGTYSVNFKGYGQGDVQSAIAAKQAQDQLGLSQKFDSQNIAQALQQEALADPQSVAAKAMESKLIQGNINNPPTSPVADMMNKQVQDSLNAANNNSLTGLDQTRLDAAVASAQGDRGGAGPTGDFSQPLTTGFAGEQRQAQAAQAAEGFLASGASPQDHAYRVEQQNLGNLSAEVNGKTPQSQFAALSGAQNGPTPMVTAASLPTMPGGQQQAIDQTAIGIAQSQNRYNASQANPWMTGMSSLINVAGTAGQMGWKPFATAS